MRYVVITGASQGIGFALTKASLNKSDSVLAVVRSLEHSKELLNLKRGYPSLEIVAVDLTQKNAANIISSALEKWPRVDILINNAGIFLESETRDDFLNSFLVNTVVPFEIVQAIKNKLKEASHPKSVEITSQMGSISDSSGGYLTYRSSKAALNMLIKSLSFEQSWLNFILIHPGWVRTRMGGASAPMTPEESAEKIWKVIDSSKIEDSGKFRDYLGKFLNW